MKLMQMRVLGCRRLRDVLEPSALQKCLDSTAALLSIVSGAALIASSCASANEGDADSDIGRSFALLENRPAELVIGAQRFVPEEALSAGELKELKDPSLWEPPETVDKLAQLLREYVLDPKFGPYVEAEPNYQLARISLGLEKSRFADRTVPAKPSDDTVEKTISTDGDQRVKVTTPTNNPGSAIGMIESGGSGVNLAFAGAGGSGSRVYTAGHVLYNNPRLGGPQGWICADSSAHVLGCNGRTPPTYLGRFRFGGKMTNSTTTWAGGFPTCTVLRGVPSGWRNMPLGTTLEVLARWDYGRVVMDGCVPSGTGALGWWVSTQPELRGALITAFGYPLRSHCPALSNGSPSDCDNNGNPWTEVFPSSPPYTDGSVFVSASVTDGALTQTNGYIKTRKVDTTNGNSGGPITAWDSATSAWYVVGVDSSHNDDGLGTNYFNSATWEVVNYVLQ
jgi:V8-like Glu-specific endopeptidase